MASHVLHQLANMDPNVVNKAASAVSVGVGLVLGWTLAKLVTRAPSNTWKALLTVNHKLVLCVPGNVKMSPNQLARHCASASVSVHWI